MSGTSDYGNGDRLTVLYSFPHVIGAPGIGSTAMAQVVGLIESGHEVHLVTAGMTRPIPGLASLICTLRVGPVRVRPRLIGRRRAYRLHDVLAMRRVERIVPHVVHTWPSGALRTLRRAAELGIPGLRESPNTHTEHAFARVAAELDALGLAESGQTAHTFDAGRLAVERAELDVASHVLVPSEAVADSYRVRGFAEHRLLRTQYGAERPASEPIRDHRAPFTALFLGRVEPRKGVHHALAAWADSEAARHGGRLLVVGDVVPGYDELLRRWGDLPGVEFRPFTSDPGLLLASADALLLPTVEEGSALVTYEAQSHGCVILVSDAAGAMLETGRTGLVHAVGDVAGLRSQIDLLFRQPETLRAMQRNAREYSANLTWGVAASRLSDAYRRACADVRSTRLTAADVSVVICTRNRPDRLAQALLAVEAAGLGEAELIVVDSASDGSGTRDVASEHEVVRYVRVSRPGLSIARNVGLRASGRRIVVFTDDDCVPTRGWIDEAAAAFDHPRVGAVTGTMEAADGLPRRSHRPGYARISRGLDAGHGAAMAFDRELVLRIGGFDEWIGAGTWLAGAEDLDMFCRVLATGRLIRHAPGFAVTHANVRIGRDFLALHKGYGRGVGGMVGKWLRRWPIAGLGLASRSVARALRGALGATGDAAAGRSFLLGVGQGFLRSLRLTVLGPVIVQGPVSWDRPPHADEQIWQEGVASDRDPLT